MEASQVKDSLPLPRIELDLVRKLRDPEYRKRFFLVEASADIARQLIELRKRRRYSQRELADRAGMKQPAISRVERANYQNWSFNTLRRLVEAMDARLRVIIEPWEDILPEYEQESDYALARNLIASKDDQAKQTQTYSASTETPHTIEAALARPPSSSVFFAYQGRLSHFNVESGIGAKLGGFQPSGHQLVKREFA
jgi:transcriptional regulator with XRE-family HTH domain